MKYTRPAYINEEIETVDVMSTSMYTVAYEDMYKTDENGNLVYENGELVYVGKKTVIGVDVSKLF